MAGAAQVCCESARNPRHKGEVQDRARRIDEPGGVPYKPRQSRARTELCLTDKLRKTRVLRAAEKVP